MKYLKEVRERFRAAPAFEMRDLRVFLRDRGIREPYLQLLAHNLVARGEVRRIRRGVYTFREDAQVVGFGFRPLYYGLQDALSLRDLWDQETNPVVITPRSVRNGVRLFDGRNYLVRRIDRSMFFGFELVKYADFWVPVSDPEKTLIDFAYYREYLPPDAKRELARRSRPAVMAEYLRRCPERVRDSLPRLASYRGADRRPDERWSRAW